jgi:hypothetical protein
MGISTCKRIKWNPYFTPYIKITLVKEIIKLLEESKMKHLLDVGFGNIFLNMDTETGNKTKSK